MTNVLTKVGLGVALAATSLTVAAPAEAQRYYHRDRGSDAGTAIVAGIAGLAIGAAIASSSNDRYYDRGYDNRYYYDRGPRYNYAPRYNYYQPRYNYRQHCRTQRVWDGYERRYVRVRHCR